MEIAILLLAIILYIRPRNESWVKQGRCPFETGRKLTEIDEYSRRVKRRLDNAQAYLGEATANGDAELLEYAIEERLKAERMIEEFKRKHGL